MPETFHAGRLRSLSDEDEAVSPFFHLEQSQEPSDILETEDVTRLDERK